MKTYTLAQLNHILDQHQKWVHTGGEEGEQADFSNADLKHACLREALLIQANFSNANLRYADLQGAMLMKSNFNGAILTGANLTGASLWGTDLSGVASFWNTVGNGLEIKTVDTSRWKVAYTDTHMQIGCQLHSFEDWWKFSDLEISNMSASAIEWWTVWKPILQQIIKHTRT